MATLPDEYRSVLVAKYVEGLSVAAIAAAQGKTSKAIESVLTRARERLRKLLLSVAKPSLHKCEAHAGE